MIFFIPRTPGFSWGPFRRGYLGHLKERLGALVSKLWTVYFTNSLNLWNSFVKLLEQRGQAPWFFFGQVVSGGLPWLFAFYFERGLTLPGATTEGLSFRFRSILDMFSQGLPVRSAEHILGTEHRDSSLVVLYWSDWFGFRLGLLGKIKISLKNCLRTNLSNTDV